ncbi:MAG: hypothetical protein KAS32_13835 [Candidatus Peribacteraceae bacterium]|nr:hypothetical protein [Candidatus Peribacteraceae bacterium]
MNDNEKLIKQIKEIEKTEGLPVGYIADLLYKKGAEGYDAGKILNLGFAIWMERMEWAFTLMGRVAYLGRCAGVSFDELAAALVMVDRMVHRDDWSLQGKLIHIMDSKGWMHHVYAPPIMITLRQKLIKDIESMRLNRETRGDLHMAQEVHDIKNRIYLNVMAKINKRFGVTSKQKDAMNTME